MVCFLTSRIDQSKQPISPPRAKRQRFCASMLSKWIGLLLLALVILHRNTKMITACILISSRQTNVTDVQNLMSVVVESFSSGRSGIFLLRGSFRDQEEHTGSLPIESSDPSDLHQSLTASLLQERTDSYSRTTLSDKNGDKPSSFEPEETIDEKPASSSENISTSPTLENESLNETGAHQAKWDLYYTDNAVKSTNNTVKVLCLSGEPYGRTMNQYIQLAVILHQLGVNGTSVVAFKNPPFNRFFKEWFDPRDDVWVDYDENGPCDAEYEADYLHYLFFADKWKQVAYQFKTLIPKASIRKEAELAMKEYSGKHGVPVTTVHRRDLEGACVLFAEQKNLIACPNARSSYELDVADYKNACLIDYPMIVDETHGTNVVLFTDSQVPEIDETFPIISNHSFPVQSWMMAISTVHYGNPFSTVDVVVYYWRKALSEKSDTIDDMRPAACYKSTPIEQHTT